MKNTRLMRIALESALFGLLFILIVAFQNVLGPKLAIFGIAADFAPYLVGFAAALTGPEGGLAAGAFIGLLTDASAGKVEGFYTVLFLLCGVGIGLLCQKYYRKRLPTGLLMGCACFIAVGLLRLLFFNVLFNPEQITYLFTRIVPSCLWSGLLSTPLWFLMALIEKKAGGNENLV